MEPSVLLQDLLMALWIALESALCKFFLEKVKKGVDNLKD